MRKLLRADFARLKASKTFWLTLAGMLALCLYMVLQHYQWAARYPDRVIYYENELFNYAPFLCFCSAVIVGMFTGSDYSDGTIRNKLIVGSRRGDIYLSHLIVGCVASAAVVAVCVATMLLGLPASDGFGIGNARTAAMLLLSVPCAMAFSAICTAIALGIQNRTAAVIVAFVAMLMLFCGSLLCNGRLNQPETTMPYAVTIDGVTTGKEEPNPFHVDGVEREIYQWIHDILPTGQVIQMADGAKPDHMERWPFTSALVILLSSEIGYAIFKRKDIK